MSKNSSDKSGCGCLVFALGMGAIYMMRHGQNPLQVIGSVLSFLFQALSTVLSTVASWLTGR